MKSFCFLRSSRCFFLHITSAFQICFLLTINFIIHISPIIVQPLALFLSSLPNHLQNKKMVQHTICTIFETYFLYCPILTKEVPFQPVFLLLYQIQVPVQSPYIHLLLSDQSVYSPPDDKQLPHILSHLP